VLLLGSGRGTLHFLRVFFLFAFVLFLFLFFALLRGGRLFGEDGEVGVGATQVVLEVLGVLVQVDLDAAEWGSGYNYVVWVWTVLWGREGGGLLSSVISVSMFNAFGIIIMMVGARN
jgi:hypothetical protein